jgi:hypothetical protein
MKSKFRRHYRRVSPNRNGLPQQQNVYHISAAAPIQAIFWTADGPAAITRSDRRCVVGGASASLRSPLLRLLLSQEPPRYSRPRENRLMEEQPHEHIEHAEHAEDAAHSGSSFLITVSATIAVLAVVAAVLASLESVETATAIGEKNEAVLKQNQASDQWAFYQAKSLKQKMYEIAAAAGGAKADDFVKEANRNATESKEIQKRAEELEKIRDEKLAEAETHEKRAHRLTIATTLVHVGIAIATVSIITRGQRWPWHGAIVLGLAGVLVAIFTYAST